MFKAFYLLLKKIQNDDIVHNMVKPLFLHKILYKKNQQMK